jgi:cytochrome c-type biogenesis protein
MADLPLNPATLLFAVWAGLLSFLSPCVLPLVPAYLSYMTGLSAEQLTSQQSLGGRTRVLAHALAFVAGLSIVFTLFGASASLLGRLLLPHLQILTRVAGLLVIIFGLHLTGLVRIPLLYREQRADPAAHRDRGPLGALLMGAAFAAGWTPCVGPFLASLLTLASQESTVAEGMLLLFVYSLGLGLPFVLAGLGTARALRVARVLRPRLRAIEVGSGLLLILMGLLLFTDRLTLLSSWLTRMFGNGLVL